MDDATTFATKAELEQVKKEQTRMAIQIQSIDATLTGLTKAVADLAERTDRRFDDLEQGQAELRQFIADGFAELRRENVSLRSAMLTIGKK